MVTNPSQLGRERAPTPAGAAAALVWEACSLRPRREQIVEALDAGADVRLAAAVALTGRTGPLLWVALDDAGRLDALGDAYDALRTEYEMRRAQAALVVPMAAARALRPLLEAGMEPVVIKGPAIATRYRAPGLRPMDDLDLLVPPRRHAEAVATLVRTGWTQFDRAGRHYDTILFHPEAPGFAVELHKELESWRDLAHGLRSRDVWAARRPFDCMGTPAWGLPPEEELIALAVHAGKPFHHYERLIWSVDFAVLVDATGHEFDWARLGRLTDETSSRTLVAVALHHARHLGADVPDAMLRLPSGRHRAAAIARVLREDWTFTPNTATETNQLRYALADSRWRRVTLFAGDVTRRGPARAPVQLVVLAAQGFRRWLRASQLEAAGPTRLPLLVKLRLAIEVLLAYVAVRRAQFRSDLPKALRRIRRTGRRDAAGRRPVGLDDGLRLGNAVSRTLHALPTDSRCLAQSLVLVRLLARRGTQSTLVIGVKPGESFGAHAWVELGGTPLLPPMEDQFLRLVDL